MTEKPTYEKMNTLLHQIEACINSRSLCTLTESPDDCITPAHFLVGGSLISHPQTHSNSIQLSWQLVQSINKQIWKRWSSDYLQELQIRSKWQKNIEDFKKDDIVFIKEDNMPPGKWALARVCDLHPGNDEHTRVVSLKTQNNGMKRPINKLILFPVQDTKDESKIQSTEPNVTKQFRLRKNIPKSFFVIALLY